MESVDESEIISICKNMKDCSSGWDQILPRVVKSTYQNFIVPITHVMNLSIINGVVPNELKVAKVVPIYIYIIYSQDTVIDNIIAILYECEMRAV